MAAARNIVVTGVTRGLGRALVERFVERGHRVAGCGRSGEEIERLRAEHPEPHHFAAVDVADAENVAGWASEVLASLGPPDLVVNNAGVMNRQASLWELDAQEFDEIMQVNVTGTVNVIRAFVPAMIERGTGVIANLSSGWGRSTSPEVAPYCASKWAIEGLSQALAQELPNGLVAAAVNPGVIDTAMLRKCWDEHAAAYPKPDEWSHGAADFLLGIGVRDNGRALTIPG